MPGCIDRERLAVDSCNPRALATPALPAKGRITRAISVLPQLVERAMATEREKIGLIVNAVAGMGGSVGEPRQSAMMRVAA